MSAPQGAEEGGGACIVVGATGGIGAVIARHFAASEAGKRLVIAGRNRARLQDLDADLRASHPPLAVAPVQFDTLDEDAADRIAAAAISEGHAIRRVVVAVSANPAVGGLVARGVDDLAAALDAKLLGALRAVRSCAPHMDEATVILFSGASAFRPTADSLTISTANAAVNMATQCLAAELAPRVRVVAVAPGPVATPRWDQLVRQVAARDRIDPGEAERKLAASVPAGRVAGADEIAEITEFLCSASARYITGSVLSVDGAWSIRSEGAGRL